jgi:hypothetical protein
MEMANYRALWGAVILNAIRDMNRSGAKSAGQWVFSSSNAVGSMRWICDMCGFDYHKLCQMAMSRAGRKRIITGR